MRENAKAPQDRIAQPENDGTDVPADATEPAAGTEAPQPPQPENVIVTAAEWEKLWLEISEIRQAIERDKSALLQKDQAFNLLYDELDGYKRANAFLELKPLYIDLILLYDRMHAARQQCDASASALLASLQQELLEILYRRDIEPVATVSEAFDPAVQRAVGSRIVDAPELQGKVLSVLRVGFTCRGNVLRPQEVITGRLRA
jgi:molecular chaperone GrpE (heat shock protein)